MPRKGVKTVWDATVRPHRPVQLSFVAEPAQVKVQILQKPPEVPAIPPVGPQLPAKDWEGAKVQARHVLEEAESLGWEDPGQDLMSRVDGLYSTFVGGAAEELERVHGQRRVPTRSSESPP